MKKLLLTLAMLLIAVPAFCATVEWKGGLNVNQYKIIDPGNASGFDNNIVYEAALVDEVVIQASSINNHTSKESYICADGVSDLEECPLEMPILTFLWSIHYTNFSYEGELTDLATKAIYRAFWYEYIIKGVANNALDYYEVEGYNDLQKIRSLKSVYFGNGVDMVTAQSLAAYYVNNPIIGEPTHDELGLATMSLQYRRVLKIFNEVGWFE